MCKASTVQRSADEDWSYKKPVTVTNSLSTLTRYDILIEMDTASLISVGKMQSDCDDLRVADSDGSTQLKYWIEGGCYTASTQVPQIEDGGEPMIRC